MLPTKRGRNGSLSLRIFRQYSRSVDKDGNVCVTGYGAMLTHSGTYIAVNGMDEEDITTGDLIFFKADQIPGYRNNEGKEYIPALLQRDSIAAHLGAGRKGR